jgi:cell division septum initiation protein DivIVA
MIRSANLPHAFRGFDENATLALLGELAASAEESTAAKLALEAKCSQLSEQVDALTTVVEELEAAVFEQSRKLETSRGYEQRIAELEHALEDRDRAAAAQPAGPDSLELIRNASRTVEQLLAQARSEAARVTEEAGTEAERLLEDARSNFRRAHDDVAQLRLLLDETRSGLAQSMKAALGALEPGEHPDKEPSLFSGDLTEDLLPSTPSEPSPFTPVVLSDDQQSDHQGSSETYDSDHPVFDDPNT